jgi:hypothetical protein
MQEILAERLHVGPMFPSFIGNKVILKWALYIANILEARQ